MDKKVFIAPSTDPCKSVEDLIIYAKEISPYADFLHVDVMDGKFVERKTIDYNVALQVYCKTSIPFDVHLMIADPIRYIKEYRKAGAVNITVHFEAFKNKKSALACLKAIKKLGIMCGISIKPMTSVSEIRDILSFVDVVLVMSVEPGKSGQTFIENTLQKIGELNKIRNEYNAKYLIEVDGGINADNHEKIINAGADILVSGSFLYKAQNKEQAINDLRN